MTNVNAPRVAKALLLTVTIIGFASGLVYVISRYSATTQSIALITHRVAPTVLTVSVTADGTLESSENIEIKCKVKGGSTVLWVIETGTLVKPGDVLVELDRSQIEDKVLQQQIEYETALANKLISESDFAVAKISIREYDEGTFKSDREAIEKEIFDAQQKVKKAELSLQSATRLAAKGIFRGTQLDGEQFSLDSAAKELQLARTKLKALDEFTRPKTLQELESKLKAAEAKLAADQANLELETQRLKREKEQLENCTIRSTGYGLVIFPSAAAWKDTPDIEEGAVVREQQTLLMIPDLNKMQVKVGIHESKVDRLKPGMKAKVQIQGNVFDGVVDSIAEVTRPAGWWTGNMVKYDTIVKLDSPSGLKPGMSAIAEIVLADHRDVLAIPVACVVEVNDKHYCWVQRDGEVLNRLVKIGDTNDEFIEIKSGLLSGDEVVLNPLAQIPESQQLLEQETNPDNDQKGTSKDGLVSDSDSIESANRGS